MKYSLTMFRNVELIIHRPWNLNNVNISCIIFIIAGIVIRSQLFSFICRNHEQNVEKKWGERIGLLKNNI